MWGRTPFLPGLSERRSRMHQPRPLRLADSLTSQMFSQFVEVIRYVSSQKLRARTRFQFILAERCRNQPDLRGSIFRVFAGPMNVSAAVKKDQKFESIGYHAPSDAFLKSPFFRYEIPARRKICCRHRISFDSNRLDLAAGLFAELHHFQRFFNVQSSRLSLRVTPIVIVHTICNIRVLLNLTED